jgi:hypothetical protein
MGAVRAGLTLTKRCAAGFLIFFSRGNPAQVIALISAELANATFRVIVLYKVLLKSALSKVKRIVISTAITRILCGSYYRYCSPLQEVARMPEKGKRRIEMLAEAADQQQPLAARESVQSGQVLPRAKFWGWLLRARPSEMATCIDPYCDRIHLSSARSGRLAG